jgi:transcriptional regulator with GAF, ATPase, and Fis domain
MNQPDMSTSPGMTAVRDMIARVATTTAAVLLTGESGVGKEVAARAIHRASPRAGNEFVKVNCAALPGDLLESELFGHQRGAFTGAHRDKPGKFELAAKGTILLDEIGEVPLRLQAKLLHVLQDGEFARVGGERVLHTDVRVIAATNRDLAAEIRASRFREDLYYRLNVIEIRIPPLRDRRDEIPGLIDQFLATANAAYRRSVELPASTRRLLLEYSWPGNIRQLENAVEHAVAMTGQEKEIPARSLPEDILQPASSLLLPTVAIPDEGINFTSVVSQLERELIVRCLEKTGGNKRQAARLLQLSRTTLIDKLHRLNLGDEFPAAS